MLQTVLTTLDEEKHTISLQKCKFACKQIEWLRCTITSEGTEPLLEKTGDFGKLSPSKFLNN